MYDKNRVSKLIHFVYFVLKFLERLSSENLSIIAKFEHWVDGGREEKGLSSARMFLFWRHFHVITVTCMQFIQDCYVYSGQIKSLFETSSPV